MQTLLEALGALERKPDYVHPEYSEEDHRGRWNTYLKNPEDLNRELEQARMEVEERERIARGEPSPIPRPGFIQQGLTPEEEDRKNLYLELYGPGREPGSSVGNFIRDMFEKALGTESGEETGAFLEQLFGSR
jgi:hypothetical protein